jgi:drug/metabolite transporter (DMT)-like permease
MISNLRYFLLMHLIVFIWGFTGIVGKLINLEAIPIVWYRVFIAAASLGLFMLFTKKSLRINRNEFLKLSIVGCIVVAHWITFYQAIQLSTASLGILCLSTATLHVTWLEPIILKKNFSWIEFFFGLLVIYGIYFVSGDFSLTEMNAVLIGLLSALFAALFAVSNAKLAESMPTIKITFYEMGIGFLAITIFLIFSGGINKNLFVLSSSDISWLLFLGVVCTSFAFLVTIDIVKRLGAFTVSLSINLEPVYTIILAILILKENEMLNTKFYIGAALIVLIVLLNGIVKYYLNRKNNIHQKQLSNGIQ